MSGGTWSSTLSASTRSVTVTNAITSSTTYEVRAVGTVSGSYSAAASTTVAVYTNVDGILSASPTSTTYNGSTTLTYSATAGTNNTITSWSLNEGSTVIASGTGAKSSTTVTRSNLSVGTHTYTLTITGQYNTVTKTVNVAVGTAPNPITVTTPQSKSANYNKNAQGVSFTGASNAQGSVTYAIQSQPSGNYFSIPTSSSAAIRVAPLTPAGSYQVTVRATAAGNSNYSSGYKDIVLNFTITAYTVTLNKGTGISTVTYQLGSGSVTTYSAAVTVPVNETVTLGATASTGYSWSQWSGTYSSTTNAYSFTMPASNVSETANASVNPYTLTANANSGTISATTGWTVASGGGTATKSVNYGAQYGTLPTVSRTGYDLAG